MEDYDDVVNLLENLIVFVVRVMARNMPERLNEFTMSQIARM